MTRKFLTSLFVLAFLWFASGQVQAQQPAPPEITKINLPQAEIDRIIKAFSAKEAEFRQALTQYGFKREATIQTIGFGGQVTGEYRRDSHFVFADNGDRFEKVLFAPLPTLKEVQMTAEDLTDLNGVNQFALEASKINLYNFTLVGKEKIDELNLYVFDVAPKVMPDPKKTKERLFQGRIWVDDVDLQIVKSKGKGVPEWRDNKFPIVEIWRENIDGKYWFPTYSYANDQLYFEKSGQTVRLKMKVKFTDYKQGHSDVRILDDEEVVNDKPQPTPKKP